MKLLLLVFASFGFLVTPAGGGGASCARTYPGRCKVFCDSLERAIFMCDRYKLCCVNDLIKTIAPPPVHKPKDPCKRITRRQNKERQMATTPQPLSSPSTQLSYGTSTNG